jgi:hypothetical protein
LKAALAYFNQAIEEDPKYAQAYSGLVDTYALLGDCVCSDDPKQACKAKAAAINFGIGQRSAKPQLACIRLDGSFDFDLAERISRH